MSEKKLDPKIWRTVAVVLLGPFMTQIDSTVVNVSLATIQDALHASVGSVQWIIGGYLLAQALMLPLNGWLVDRIGAKRLYLGCFTAFTVASLLCGASRSIQALICARVIQGIAGGLLAPMTQLMIARVAGRHMARVIGYAAVPILLAPILGPVLAGAILKFAGWPWLFYINLPIGIFAVILAMVLLPSDASTSGGRPFDFLGFLLISPGLACLLYGFDHASHLNGAIFLGVGLILICGFGWDARRKQSLALIDLKLFKNPVFSTAVATLFLANGMAYAGQMLIPLYLISGWGFSPSKAGWIIAPMGIGMICFYPLMGFLVEKFGCRAVSASGVVLNTLGTLPFLWMIQHEFSPTLMALCMVVRGAGQGAIGIPSVSSAYASVPKEKLSLATTAANIVQRLGGPVATTLMAVVVSFSASHFPSLGPQVFMIPFIVLIGLQLLVLGSACRLPARTPLGESVLA